MISGTPLTNPATAEMIELVDWFNDVDGHCGVNDAHEPQRPTDAESSNGIAHGGLVVNSS